VAPSSAPSRTPGTPASERELRTQGKQTMANLLDAGMEVLTERGYHAARVDDIVRVARTSHGTFYLYFANKEDLFRALAAECAEEMKTLAASLGPIGPGADGEAELRQWVAQFLDTYRRYGAVIRAWMEDQVTDRKLVRLGLEAFQSISASLEAKIADAGARHLDDTTLATSTLLAMVERFAYFSSSRDLGLDDDVAIDTLTKMIHRGFFGAPARGKQRR
jgi:AcrR family transcriptional regulator